MLNELSKAAHNRETRVKTMHAAARPMRVLMAHNRYLERGGEDGSTEAEIRLLREHGSEVDFFERDNREIECIGLARTAFRTVWSQETYRVVRKHLREKAYDVVHVQNFFPLISPAIYYAARAEGVPVVQTIRNFRLVCPGANLLREGHVCETCIGKPFAWPGIVHGCYRGSRLSSAAVAMATASHRLAGTWRNRVDRYIALTDFTRAKLIQGGFPGDRIAVKPNFVFPDPGARSGKGGHFIYVGRLSEEKGLDLLIDAWQEARVDVPLLIVGNGPDEARLKARCRNIPGIKFLGRKPIAEVYELVGQAIALCFPSVCYENFPRTIIEAFAVATPVVANRHGAIPAIIAEGETGFLAEPGRSSDIAEHLKIAAADPARMARMGKTAREVFTRSYTGKANYSQLLSIYEEARSVSAN